MKDTRTAIIEVERSLPSERLDNYLTARFPVVSRGQVRRLIVEGHILVNGRTAKPSHHPKAGEVVEVHWPPPKSDRAEPEAIPLEVLFEDADLIVINKPPGMVVHPASGSESNTLVNALLHHCEGQLSGIGGVARPGVVHRLDKDTSGCIVAAKNDSAHVHLSDQFKARTVRKIYHAIVRGAGLPEKGDIQAAIARHASHRKVMAVSHERGRTARTTYKVLRVLDGAALVEARLHTGRTHQIRVHFKHIGHPLVGDAVYGKKAGQQMRALEDNPAPRQMLHARSLGFIHPRLEKWMECQSPWPEDFKRVVEALSLKDADTPERNRDSAEPSIETP